MINLKYLKLIKAIDKYGSLSQASKELHLTQSALSHQLKNLEEYLGLKLFNRVDNKLHFTDAGIELKNRSESILSDLSSLEDSMIDFKKSYQNRYIHGYSPQEAQRLSDQANSIADYLHYDSIWEPGSTILEIGCGTGAQTEIIAEQNPECSFTSIDISKKSLEMAQSRIAAKEINNVTFKQMDAYKLAAGKAVKYDHIFICFLLEHLTNPHELLYSLHDILNPNGTITVIEGDHGSTYFHPDNEYAHKVINAQVQLQNKNGGNANFGRQLYSILSRAKYENIQVSPRQIYVDHSKPNLVDGFIKNTFTSMISGIREEALANKILSPSEFDLGIEGLLRTAESDGVFNYTFFKAKGYVG